ncbi:MAG: permease-like cell division protein FtsX [Rikenellaceae bacterium]
MKEDKRLKRKVRNSYAISTISISLVLFLLGSVGYLMVSAMDAAHALRENISATVELSRGVNEQQRDDIRRRIVAYPLSGEITFSSKSEKAEDEEFRKMFGVEFENILEDNPLMDSFNVQLSTQASNKDMLQDFVAAVESIEGVSRVSYPAQLIDKVHSMVGTFQTILLCFGGVLLFISLILLSNTVRLAIYSRRYLINTMKLVGATKWFIIRPFMWSGIVCGFWAGVLASILFGGMTYALMESLPELFAWEQIERAAIAMGSMVVCGVLISALFTLLAVNKYVNMTANKIHIY